LEDGTMSDLERRIAAALEDEITSADLAALLQETEAAITQADADAEAKRKMALDLTLSADARGAREAQQVAESVRDRLCFALPRLKARYQKIAAQENLAQWQAEYAAVEAARDALAAEWRQVYPELVTKIADLFTRTAECDREGSRINGSAPSGEHRRLRSVELTARGLDSFTTANPSIAKTMQLPDFEHSAKMAWPPPSTPLAVLASQAMPAPPHSGGEWWRGREERAAAQRAEQARVAAYYEDMERQREEREAAEAQARRSRA
jgi:hypothetical protein